MAAPAQSDMVTIQLPALNEFDPNWRDCSFSTVHVPRLWMAVDMLGVGKNPTCKTRLENPNLFTGIYYHKFAHTTIPYRSGIGEQASSGKQTAACLLVMAATPDNQPMMVALGLGSTKKNALQIAVVNQQENLKSSTGWAIEGIVTDYGTENYCFYVRIQATAHCENHRQITGAAGVAYKAGGNLVGQNYDYAENMADSPRTAKLHKFLSDTLTKLKI